MPTWENAALGKCRLGKMPPWEVATWEVAVVECAGGKVPGAKCPRTIYLMGPLSTSVSVTVFRFPNS